MLLPEDDPDCMPKMGKVKGTIFENTSGRPSIPGVNVVITDSSGKSLTVTTDVTGMYMVEVLAGCTIADIVQSSLPTRAVQTLGTNPMTLAVPAGGTATDSDGFQIPGPPGPTPGPTHAATLRPTPFTAPEPECKGPYEDWVDCINLEECSDCDMSIPGDSASEAQTPGVNWDTFFDWYLQNVQCCKERCNDELNAFADCKDCGVPPSPTPCPTPQTTPSPTPPPVLMQSPI